MRLFRNEMFPSLPAGRRGDGATSHRARRYGVSSAKPQPASLKVESLTLPTLRIAPCESEPQPVPRVA